MERNAMFWLSGFIIDLGIVLWILATFVPGSMDYLYLLANEPVTTVIDLELLQFAVGVMGAVTIGWGIILMYFSQYHAENAKPFLLASLSVWLVTDCTVSIITGFYFNLIGNIAIFAISWIVISKHYNDSSGA